MAGGLGVPVASLSFDEAIARFASQGFTVVSRSETEAYPDQGKSEGLVASRVASLGALRHWGGGR